MWIKQILNVNIINFAKVDKGGGKKLIHKKWIICRIFFWNPSLNQEQFKTEYKKFGLR